jgi:hypothetical protein
MYFIRKVATIPAQYTETDPFDIRTMTTLVDDLRTDWFMQDPERQRQAISNALRAALVSPRQNLQWNSIVYQDMQDLGYDVDNPQVYEDHIRNKKTTWDSFGQMTLDSMSALGDNQMVQYAPHMVQKYQPGMWGNVRNAANHVPHIEELRKVALEDIGQGGDGRWWRDKVMELGIPGVGPKIASFAWLLLVPDKSKLSTIDVHMMRALQQDQESPPTMGSYLDLEKQLDAYRVSLGYEDVPLGMFQWAVWDWQRTHGFHQDHSGLRPLDPTPWHEIDWASLDRFQNRAQPAPPQNEQLFSKIKTLY